MRLEIDHVVMCVPDLSHNPLDLETVPGGRHEGHGTANLIVPLGDSYVELVGVSDRDEANMSPFGSWVGIRSAEPGADALCIRTDEIDDLAAMLGLEVTAMSRVTPEGTVLSWRIAGLEHTVASGQPFFIQWDDMDVHPGLSDINDDVRIRSVVVSGDIGDLPAVIGPVERLSFVDGPASVEFRIGRSFLPGQT